MPIDANIVEAIDEAIRLRDKSATDLVREWDGPAALPPPTTLRVLEGLIRRRSTPCLAHPRFTQ